MCSYKHTHNSAVHTGNKPIKFIDIDGLEEGELEITNTKSKMASLTWKKVYTVVTDGKGAVHATYKLDEEQINAILNSGENTIYVNVLPGTKGEGGKEVPVKLSSEKKWKKGKAWKLNISYSVNIVGTDDCTTLFEVNVCYAENPVLEGVIMDETGPGGKSLNDKTPAAGTVGDGMIYTNTDYFGAEPTKDLTLKKDGVNSAGVITHEMGHNFGLSHADGDYTQEGVMSNKQNKIPPTKENNVEIINNNSKNIKPKQ